MIDFGPLKEGKLTLGELGASSVSYTHLDVYKRQVPLTRRKQLPQANYSPQRYNDELF